MNGNIEEACKGQHRNLYYAEYIQKAVGGDLFEIRDRIGVWTRAYRACVERSQKGMAGEMPDRS